MRKIMISLFFICMLGIFLGCYGETVVYSGHVYDKDTKAPIEGVEIYFENEYERQDETRTITDANGFYKIEGAILTDYVNNVWVQISFKKEGYSNYWVDEPDDTNDKLNYDIYMKKSN